MKNRLFFRADGNEAIGLGHIVRCLSVIQMIKEYFECVMIVNNADDNILKSIKNVCTVVDLKAENSIIEIEKISNLVKEIDIIIIDGYAFNNYYQIELKKIIQKLIVIDDLSNDEFFSEVIINHGDISVLPNYRASKNCKIYHGLDYLIVRPDFIKAAHFKKNITNIDTVFICMGGSDPYDISSKALEACIHCNFIKKIIIVIGSLYTRKSDFYKKVDLIKNVSIELIENASSDQLVNYIEKSQIAITTASTISLEVCCVKSALICGTIVNNQNAIHSLLLKNECCLSVGDWKKVSVENLISKIFSLKEISTAQKIINAQSKYFDGSSPKRILNIFKDLAA